MESQEEHNSNSMYNTIVIGLIIILIIGYVIYYLVYKQDYFGLYSKKSSENMVCTNIANSEQMKTIQIEEDSTQSDSKIEIKSPPSSDSTTKSNLQRIEESDPEQVHEFAYELDNESQNNESHKSLPTDTEMLAEYNLSNDEIENIKNKLNNS